MSNEAVVHAHPGLAHEVHGDHHEHHHHETFIT